MDFSVITKLNINAVKKLTHCLILKNVHCIIKEIGGIMNQIIKIAWDLNETTENRYQLVYEIAELAKKLVDENQLKKAKEEYSFEETSFDTSIKKENPVEHAIMVKASEYDDSGLVG